MPKSGFCIFATIRQRLCRHHISEDHAKAHYAYSNMLWSPLYPRGLHLTTLDPLAMGRSESQTQQPLQNECRVRLSSDREIARIVAQASTHQLVHSWAQSIEVWLCSATNLIVAVARLVPSVCVCASLDLLLYCHVACVGILPTATRGNVQRNPTASLAEGRYCPEWLPCGSMRSVILMVFGFYISINVPAHRYLSLSAVTACATQYKDL